MSQDGVAKDHVSLVAIHGVGNHLAGAIANQIRANLPENNPQFLSWGIDEFNWDQFVRKVPGASYASSRWAIGRVSANGHAAARLAVSDCVPGWDMWLRHWQLRLVNHTTEAVATVNTNLASRRRD